jgi:hypothetical protein
MIRHFCDLCYRQIKGQAAHYALVRPGGLGIFDSINQYDKEICEDCYRAIKDTVESIRKEEK